MQCGQCWNVTNVDNIDKCGQWVGAPLEAAFSGGAFQQGRIPARADGVELQTTTTNSIPKFQ